MSPTPQAHPINPPPPAGDRDYDESPQPLTPEERQRVEAVLRTCQPTLNRADEAISRATARRDALTDLQGAVDSLHRARHRIAEVALREDERSLMAPLVLLRQAINATIEAAEHLAPQAVRR